MIGLGQNEAQVLVAARARLSHPPHRSAPVSPLSPTAPQKQANDRMWLIFDTIFDCIKFVGVAAASVKDPGNIGNAAGSLKDIASDVRELADPSLQPVLPQIVTTLRDTSAAGADAAWSQVGPLVLSCSLGSNVCACDVMMIRRSPHPTSMKFTLSAPSAAGQG